MFPLPAVPPSVILTFIVEESRAKVSMPDVLRLRKSLFDAATVAVALETAVTASPPEPKVELLVLLNVLPTTLRVSEPALFLISKRFSPPDVSPFTKLKLEFVTADMPVRLKSLTSPSPTASPKPLTVELAIVSVETFCPLMPTWAPPVPPLPFTFKFVKVAVVTLLMLMAACAALLKVGLSMLFTVPLPLLALVKFMLASERLLVDVNRAP